MKLLQVLSSRNLTREELQKWITQWYLAAWMHKILLLSFQARLIKERHPAFSLLAAITSDELGLGDPNKNHLVLLGIYLQSIGVNPEKLEYQNDAIPSIQKFKDDTTNAWVTKPSDFGLGTMRYFEEVGDEIHKAFLQAVQRFEKTNPASRNLSYFTYHGSGAEEHHAELLQQAKRLCSNQLDEKTGYEFGKTIVTELLEGIYLDSFA